MCQFRYLGVITCFDKLGEEKYQSWLSKQKFKEEIFTNV